MYLEYNQLIFIISLQNDLKVGKLRFLCQWNHVA
jgi:hypothetical protein